MIQVRRALKQNENKREKFLINKRKVKLPNQILYGINLMLYFALHYHSPAGTI